MPQCLGCGKVVVSASNIYMRTEDGPFCSRKCYQGFYQNEADRLEMNRFHKDRDKDRCS